MQQVQQIQKYCEYIFLSLNFHLWLYALGEILISKRSFYNAFVTYNSLFCDTVIRYKKKVYIFYWCRESIATSLCRSKNDQTHICSWKKNVNFLSLKARKHVKEKPFCPKLFSIVSMVMNISFLCGQFS